MALADAILVKLREARQRHEELTELLSSEKVIADGRRVGAIMRERGSLEAKVALLRRVEELEKSRADAEHLLADPEMHAAAKEELAAIASKNAELEQAVVEALITEEGDDRRKVIMELRAGTGGDEASLFVGDLLRIYQHFFDAQHWRAEILDATPSEVGGFKEIMLAVDGDGAWRKLRFESGGHRVQRVPQTEAQGRIHTSTATVAVMPEAEEVELDINPGDLRIDTMRAGGAGGQHVNKTESAVRITHVPTNTVVVCMDHKSQHKNRASAMRILRSRLYEAERERVHAERAAMRKSKVGSGDRNARIRTYNWPQSRVTDHRAEQNYSLEQILAGKLAPMLGALEALEREERIRAL